MVTYSIDNTLHQLLIFVKAFTALRINTEGIQNIRGNDVVNNHIFVLCKLTLDNMTTIYATR